ncbi:hypothetical protein CR513_59169, partial [Mucuna pruriens]
MEEVYGGAFGTHANGHALAHMNLQAGYYWRGSEDYLDQSRRPGDHHKKTRLRRSCIGQTRSGQASQPISR